MTHPSLHHYFRSLESLSTFNSHSHPLHHQNPPSKRRTLDTKPSDRTLRTLHQHRQSRAYSPVRTNTFDNLTQLTFHPFPPSQNPRNSHPKPRTPSNSPKVSPPLVHRILVPSIHFKPLKPLKPLESSDIFSPRTTGIRSRALNITSQPLPPSAQLNHLPPIPLTNTPTPPPPASLIPHPHPHRIPIPIPPSPQIPLILSPQQSHSPTP